MEEAIAKKIDTFFTQFKFQRYKKGEIIVRADEPPSGIFYLKRGMVKKYAISSKGDELVVNLFKPISFFPMSWAINMEPNAFFYEAVEDIEIWKAPREKAVTFIKENPDVLFDLLARVYKGTEGMLTRMAYLMSGNAYARLVTELVIHAKRFGTKTGEHSFQVHISEKDLAAQSGMTRETVSREMKLLKEKGLVTFEKNMIILEDLGKLEKELSLEI